MENFISCAVLIIASVFQFCVGKHRNKMKILPFSFATDRKNSFSFDAPSRNARRTLINGRISDIFCEFIAIECKSNSYLFYRKQNFYLFLIFLMKLRINLSFLSRVIIFAVIVTSQGF